MRLLFVFLLTFSVLLANVATVVDSVGDSYVIRNNNSKKVAKKLKLQEHDIIKTGKNAKVKIFFLDNTAVSLGENTTFKIDTYVFNGKKDSDIKFKVLKGFFKTVTGQIGKIAPKHFKFQTKNATIGIRGTVFTAKISEKTDLIMCTNGTIVLFTPNGDIEVKAGTYGKAKDNAKPTVKKYSKEEKENLVKKSGWYGSMSTKELIAYIKENFKEPLKSQLLMTLQNILNKDTDERALYKNSTDFQSADDKGFVDDITVNSREFEELPKDIEFYQEDLKDGKVVVEGILESDDKNIPVNSLYVEISTDGGQSWSRASGHDEWEWGFVPELEKTYQFSLRIITLKKSDNTPIIIEGAKLQPIEFKKPNPKISTSYKQLNLQAKSIKTKPIVLKFKKQKHISIITKPIVLKFKKYKSKSIVTKPIVLKFKKFEAKSVKTKPIVLKFKKFGAQSIKTKSIVLKFKKLHPKTVTAKPIVLKFKNFAPKIITTKPIVLKHKKVSTSGETVFETTTPVIKFILKRPDVYATLTPPIKFKLKQPSRYITTTPTILFKLKQSTLYKTTTPSIMFKLHRPSAYTTTTPQIKFKLR